MRKTLLLLVLLQGPLSILSMETKLATQAINHISTEYSDQHYPTAKQGLWRHLTKNLASTFIIGSVIGSFYGASCAYLERQCPDWFAFLWPISWILFIGMKHATLESIVADAKKRNIDCHRSTLYNSAWICDWIAYCYVNKGIWPYTLESIKPHIF